MILHTETYGDGETVVLLHSGLQTGQTDFVAQQEALLESRKVIVPDLRGHGKSVSDNFSNYFQDAARDLKETLDYLEVERFHLVGCSLGGLVALLFAKAFPDRLLSLTMSGVTADQPAHWSESHKEEVKFQTDLLQNKEIVGQLDQIHDSDWKQFIYMARDVDWYPFEHTADLNRIDAPILYMVGEGNKDEVISASTYQRMHENVHVSVIPFASHLVHVEQPALYTEMLLAFLDKVEEKNRNLMESTN
ncbi:alpha/beta fold hydrolase [Alkalihalobacillus sp. R86527]|uniref:alpha/beta fold hydrolase n=1 Tax=Alkalihalobacillus sp. R86527 TaxID=3093863 RepID=UPI00366AE24D